MAKFTHKAVVRFTNCGSKSSSVKFAKSEVEAQVKLEKLAYEVRSNPCNKDVMLTIETMGK